MILGYQAYDSNRYKDPTRTSNENSFVTMSTSQSRISRFFKPVPTKATGKRPRSDEDGAETTRASKISSRSSNKAAEEENNARAHGQNTMAKMEEKRQIEVIEIDLNDDDDTKGISKGSVRLVSAREEQSSTGPSNASSQPLDSTVRVNAPEDKASNPFAMFACKSPESSAPIVTDRSTQRATWKVHEHDNRKSTSKPTTHTKPPSKSTSKNKKGFVKMGDLSKEEQHRITMKWHSLVDPNAPLEVRRYQVLVAARLHARCQEPTVRKAMAKLHETIPGGITVETVAGMDPDSVADNISNLQFYNVKAQQIVKAAQEIQTLFGGIVPEDELSLTKITGIGKCFADLLAFVNTRKQHEVIRAQATQEEPS